MRVKEKTRSARSRIDEQERKRFEEDYVYDVIVPIVNFHGVKRIKLLVEQTEGTEERRLQRKYARLQRTAI